jgi:hypothetical protein
MHWAEVSLLEQLDFKNFKFYPLKLDLQEIWTGTSGTGSGFLVFWYFWFYGFLVPVKTRV